MHFKVQIEAAQFSVVLYQQNRMLFLGFIFHMLCCLAIEVFSATSIQSRSAFGVTTRENTKATEVKLARRTFKVLSLTACNLECVNDRNCGATNYFPSTSSSENFQGLCQLLHHGHGSDVAFERQQGAIYTKLQQVIESDGTEVVQKDCDDGYSFDSSTSRCFIVPATGLAWSDAQNWCHQKGGTLAKVDSLHTLSYISSITRNILYTGLKQENNGSLVWSDGSLVQINSFISGHVSKSYCHSNETCCSLLDTDGQSRRKVALKRYQWYCRAPGYFVCEKQAHRNGGVS